jgi:phosphate transport system permease protein
LVAAAAGSTIVIAILLIAIFLFVRAVPSLRAARPVRDAT